jgi:Cu/Ag efflux protein CusF
MKMCRTIIVAAAAALASPALAQQSGESTGAQHVTPNAPVYAGHAITTRGTIESVDRETRTIVIKDEEGRLSSLRVGPEMTNFDKLEKGNKVTARYAEAMLLSLGNTGEAPKPQVDTQSSQSSQPPAGNQPSMRGVQQTRVTGKISEIDGQRNRIRLQTANGEDVMMAVPDAKNLSGLKEGDEVVATYIEAFALAVEPDDGSGTAESGGRPAPR